MTDRELLEKAAKAAGIVESKGPLRSDLGILVDKSPPTATTADCWVWNPLKDNGDALTLAVKLNIAVSQYPIYEHPKHSVLARVPSLDDSRTEVIERYNGDPSAATRRAIVRAAASIETAAQ